MVKGYEIEDEVFVDKDVTPKSIKPEIERIKLN
jgi:hypothetical protein